jgi:glutathionylspermidine synthase
VEKPLLGREGANVRLFERGHGAGATTVSDGEYGGAGVIYQALAPLPAFTGANGRSNHAVIGSWVIASQAAGVGIREDDGPITRNSSRFVPHLFR